MDVGRIFSRSLELLWKLKFLWVFGLVMGLTSGGGGGGGGNSNVSARNGSFGNPFTNVQIEPAVIVIAVIVGLILLVVGLVLFFYFRFVSRGALVATVRDVEAGGAPTLREAWKNGRMFYARLLGLGFLVNVPLVLFSICVILAALVPLFSFAFSNRGRLDDSPNQVFAALGITGILTICCAVLCLVLLSFVIHPLYEFAVRAIVLEDMPVRAGLRQGIQRARENLGNVLIVYLLLMGARIGYAILVAIVAIPVGLVLAFGAFGLLQANLNALILVALVLAIPLWLLFGAIEGVFQIFESNVWTEAYLSLLNRSEAPAGQESVISGQ
ncbi:MAG: hypothetical protein HY741_24400 [Chloroflexi bacterium]|nr:hypothetical protein [Chloroflexota bacterium]